MASPSSGTRIAPDFLICSVPRDMEENPDTGWSLNILYSGKTAFLDELLIHSGVLSGRTMPHPPHRHDHEEAHITFSGHFEFVSDETFDGGMRAKPMDAHSLVFTDSNISHTFRNAGDQPASYIHIRWKNNRTVNGMTPLGQRVYFSPRGKKPGLRRCERNGVDVTDICSGPSRFLPYLTVQFITIQVNGEIPLHRHDHEVIFITVQGTVEILGRTVVAPGAAFMTSGMPHHIRNSGHGPAGLYAFEFHREERLC